jgi:hypothetical protein
LKLRSLLVALAWFFTSLSLGRAAIAAEIRRVAIVVGANRAPAGRVPLRYAHEDARRVSEVLSSVAGFGARDIELLLDPSPAQVLSALDRELEAAGQRAGETLLFFYYSGHADERSIYPGGEPLAFADLKPRLDDPRAKLRVGVLDSCRGGSWTGSKGLKKVEPFDVDTAPQLAEEGSVLIASSSGLESAHETESLGGSFFTHYWNAGLRGAADRGGDGIVTLNEAFEYARTLTIRDTALSGQEPQHPSFQMKLSGRRDFPLATLASQRTTLLYDQISGPTEVVRLNDGLVVLEIPPGTRRVRLGLPAGSYLVRRRSPDGVFVRLVSLSGAGATALGEADLSRSTLSTGRVKDADAYESDGASWAGQHFYASVAVGVRHAPLIDPGLRIGAEDGRGVFLLRAAARLAQRLWWAAPLAVVYDAERPTAFNWLAWAGAPVVAVSHGSTGSVVAGFSGAGFDARYRGSERHLLNASVAELSPFELGTEWTKTLTTQGTLGITETVPDAVSFSLGLAFNVNLLEKGSFSASGFDSAERGVAFALGSVQRAGLRPLPLIHVPIGGGWGIDAHAVGAYVPAKRGWVETYLAGVSWVR